MNGNLRDRGRHGWNIRRDVGIPGHDGLGGTRGIREQAWGKAVTIIARTGWGRENDRERSREAGCDDHW